MTRFGLLSLADGAGDLVSSLVVGAAVLLAADRTPIVEGRTG